jgi:BTB/POZ domain
MVSSTKLETDRMITFDIGGTIHHIRSDLLMQYPHSILSIAALHDIMESNDPKPANKNSNKNSTQIFLDGNGNRFPYVLQYMMQTNLFDLPLDISHINFYQDLEYYGFGPSCHLPDDVQCLEQLQHHIITWDVCRAAAGIIFEGKNQVVKCIQSATSLGRIVFGNQAFNICIHYWSIQIKRTDPNNRIMIGVANNITAQELVAFGSETYHSGYGDI